MGGDEGENYSGDFLKTDSDGKVWGLDITSGKGKQGVQKVNITLSG